MNENTMIPATCPSVEASWIDSNAVVCSRRTSASAAQQHHGQRDRDKAGDLLVPQRADVRLS